MSVDTYLKRKNLSRYERLEGDGIEILVAPVLLEQARRISLDTVRGLFGTSIEVEIEPLGDHFHGPGCRH